MNLTPFLEESSLLYPPTPAPIPCYIPQENFLKKNPTLIPKNVISRDTEPMDEN